MLTNFNGKKLLKAISKVQKSNILLQIKKIKKGDLTDGYIFSYRLICILGVWEVLSIISLIFMACVFGTLDKYILLWYSFDIWLTISFYSLYFFSSFVFLYLNYLYSLKILLVLYNCHLMSHQGACMRHFESTCCWQRK